MITPEGIKPEGEYDCCEMTSPADKAAVRQLLGMINFLAAHIPNMSTITAPLQSLLKSETFFNCGPEQTSVLTKVKENLSTAPVLQLL